MAAPVMLVAGGSGSIGRAIAAHAQAAGWRVALHGSGAASAAAAADGLGDACRPFGADLTVPDAAPALLADVAAWAGRIDAVVDCVSTGPRARLSGPFAATEPAAYGAFLDLSVAHLQRLAHAALPHLAETRGTLIAFASDAGAFAAPRQAIVAASRAAIMAFVRNLALEAARDGVTAHCVSPGFVADTATADRLAGSDRLERARAKAGLGLPTPADIAPLVLFLCGPGARRITGQVISVNGGTNA